MIPKHIKAAVELGRKVYHFAPGEAVLYSGQKDYIEATDIQLEGNYSYGKGKSISYGRSDQGQEGLAGDF